MDAEAELDSTVVLKELDRLAAEVERLRKAAAEAEAAALAAPRGGEQIKIESRTCAGE
jgi:hypothetical protein